MLVFVFIVFASFAFAQQPQRQGGGPGAGFGGAMGEIQRFAFTEGGQKDLGLTADDVTKLREALRPAGGPQQGNQNATPEERQKAAEETAKKVAGLLSKHQMELVEIRAFQLGGFAGLNGRYAQAALKVTDAQKAKITEIARENRTAQGRGGTQNANMTPEERRARMEENRKVLGEKFKDVLTAEQKTKADELLKEIPAYIKEIQDRPAFGAGGQGGGNRGAGGGGNRGNRGGNN